PVTIPAGAISASITVTPTDDQLVEGSENVTVTLVNGPDYDLDLVNSLSCATITISDDDSKSSVALVPTGSTWKYLDDGSNQGSAWHAAGFDDSSWSSGPARLGYGSGDEKTVVSYGTDANNKYITTYFRHSFTVADPSVYTGLTAQLLRYDGAVVYLNGTEVFRSNMPTGMIGYQTL